MNTRFVAIALAGWLVFGAAQAAPEIERLWESAPDFLQPESVLFDHDRDLLFVSNINGGPTEKNGQGFISTVGLDGRIAKLHWLDGLNAPKGMARIGKRLFVSDIDALVEIDIEAERIVARYPASDARFLNDLAADDEGRVYVSDMMTNRIYRLEDGRFEPWVDSPRLAGPNGLAIVGANLYVGCWGAMEADFSTKVPGHVLRISLLDRQITDFGADRPVGNLDGIEAFDDGSLLASDWMAGGLMRIAADGHVERLDPLAQGSADIGYDPGSRTVWVPMMKHGKVIAIRIAR